MSAAVQPLLAVFSVYNAMDAFLRGDLFANRHPEKDSFTREELDAIAQKLTLDDPCEHTRNPLSLFFKPHHNTLTGNYDVNVLIAALEGRGKSVIWHDCRGGASSIDLTRSEETLVGIVLNISTRKLGGLWRSRHWVALRRIEGFWYNLDSDLKIPRQFQCQEEVIRFVDDMINQGAEVLIILHDKQ